MQRRKHATMVIALIVLSFALIALAGSGRAISSCAGKGALQVLKVDKMKQFISMSFRRSGDSTIRDVTYLADDGYVYTIEFEDLSPPKGRIRWVPSTESAWRTIIHWTDVKLPEDCKEVKGVDVAVVSAKTLGITLKERVKSLTYLSTDGHIYCKEFREGFLRPHKSGWIEVARES